MVGDMLRKERERQNLSVKDIEKGTSIRAVYIEAIEKGDYKVLPADVYAKGFVRNYANFLKMDADTCVRQYQSEVHGSAPAPAEESAPQSSENKKAEAFSTGRDYKNKIEQPYRRQKVILTVLMAGIILIGGWAAFGSGLSETGGSEEIAKHQTSAADKKSSRQEDKVSSKTEERSNPPAVVPAPAPAVQSVEGVHLQAKFTDRCWMEVIADGAVVYEGTSEAGHSMSWNAKEKIEITVGNAGAVELTHNGKLIGNPGDYGTVVEQTYTKNMP